VKLNPLSILLGVALLGTSACRETHEHDEGDEHAAEGHGHEGHVHGGHGHEHGGEGEPGASFKADKGITLSDEVRKLMELQVSAVELRAITPKLLFNAQVYQSGASSFASAILPVTTGMPPTVGTTVPVKTVEGKSFTGTITEVQTNSAAAFGGMEVLLELPTTLPMNSHLTGELVLQKREALQVPASAVLRTVEGAFVYAQNGEAYLRTAVQTGEVQQGMVEVVAGLKAGVEVVAYPVQTLWLIELRAVKGGGHSH